MAKSKIPEITAHGLKMYVQHGLRPGHFLRGMLNNDVLNAYAYADTANRAAIGELIVEITRLPAGCWGCVSSVEMWCGHKGLEGMTTK